MSNFYNVTLVMLAVIIGCSPITYANAAQISTSKNESADIATGSPFSDDSFYYATKDKEPFPSLWDDVWKLPDIIVEDTKEIVRNDDYLFWLLAAGGASVVMHNSGADRRIAEGTFNKPQINKDLDEVMYFLGGPGFHFAFTGLWYLWDAETGDIKGQEEAWTMLKALSVTGALTLGLKAIRDNRTPNDKLWGWPSGHTSSSFTVAAVLDELYGPQVGWPAYIGASAVGWRMMDSGDHWASDVLFGGIMGYIVGHHVAGKHEVNRVAGFELVPITSFDNEPAMGLGLYKQF